MHVKPRGLGSLLLEAGLITEEQLATALHEQQGTRDRLGTILLRLGLVTEESLLDTLSRQLGIDRFVPGSMTISPDAVSTVPRDVAHKYEVLPVQIREGKIVVVMGDPLNLDALDDLRVLTGRTVEPLLGSASFIKKAQEMHYGRLEGSRDIEDTLQMATVVLGESTHDGVVVVVLQPAEALGVDEIDPDRRADE